MSPLRLSMLALVALLSACGDKDPEDSGAAGADTGDAADGDAGEHSGVTDGGDTGDTGGGDTGGAGPDPFADAVVSFTPGEAAGFGEEGLPDIVLGGPEGSGGGSLDVLSLGREGEIVLEFTDIGLVDGEGPDLLVFENPFPGWIETGVVAVSEDGETWHEWTCADEDEVGGFPGCAGVTPVLANSDNGIDATDPAAAGGDAFDLADLGVERARYVRIRDTGSNSYEGTSGGFDLDAVAVVHGEAL